MLSYLVTGVAAAVLGGCLGWWARARRMPPPPHGPAAAQSPDEVSALAGGLAHEVRNPLSTLKVNLQLLREDWAEPTADNQELRRRSLERLAVLETETARVHDIVDDFLRLVGREEPHLVETDANAVIREFAAFYEPQARAAGVQMRLELADRPLPCRIDPDLIKQVLLNLSINALEAMPQGGTLTIRTAREGNPAHPPRERTGRGPAGCVRIDVADTGVGLSAEAAGRIFEPFYSTKRRGTGLGLAITRRIIRAHQGTIAAVGAPGRGTTFTIHLPSSDSPAEDRPTG